MVSSLIIPIYSMNKKIIFNTAAVLLSIALIFHVKGFFYPSPPTPAWRHGVFVLINITCIYGVLKRPGWFLWFVVSLTMQQWYSHGSYILEFWKLQHRVHWISVGAIVLMPVLFFVLLADRKTKKKVSANPLHS